MNTIRSFPVNGVCVPGEKRSHQEHLSEEHKYKEHSPAELSPEEHSLWLAELYGRVTSGLQPVLDFLQQQLECQQAILSCFSPESRLLAHQQSQNTPSTGLHFDLPVMEYDHRHHLYIGIFGILDGYLSLNYQDKSKAQQVLNRGTIQHLYPHIKQAIKLSWKVEQNHSHNEAIDYTLQHYPIPLMAVDDRYRLVVKNRAAGQLTTNSTIGPHQNRKPLLDTNNRQQMDESLWHKAICKYVERHTRDQPADNKRVELKINNTNHPVLISPSSGSASFFKRSPHRQLYWLYFFNDNLFEQIDTMQLSEQAGFTAAESDVALLLARGFTLAEIAESRKVSLETIKKQRNSIFRKTRCDTQEQLLIFLFEQVIYTLSSRTN